LSTLNAVIGWLFDRLLAPLAMLSPLAGLAVVSLVTAVAMLLCIRVASNQARLAEVKRQIHACIFECRLFQDDLPAVFRALGEMLWSNVLYVGLSLRPLLWAAVPMALLLTQLDLFFGYRAAAREPRLLTARMGDAAALPNGAASALLEAPDGVRVLTPPIWIPATGELVWKVEPRESGAYVVRVRVGAWTFDKTLVASDGPARRSPVRPSEGLIAQMINPAEAPIPGGTPVSEVRIDYVPRTVVLMGWQMPWVVPYLIFSVLWGFALKKPLKVRM
jgi:hypothetical protein